MAQTGRVVENLFRHNAGRITATLARTLGPERLDLAEEAVADALEQALRSWPHTGVPDNASGWLFSAARNRATDLLRREQRLRAKLPALAALDVSGQGAPDAELELMLLCCHPDLPEASRVALTLRTVGGLGVEQIAAALLTKPATIAQRLTRAKRWLRDSGQPLGIPGTEQVESRVDSVLSVLYLMFNEGYDANSGDTAIRAELCGEAIRLAELLQGNRSTRTPKATALLALLRLQASRLPARVDDHGDLLLLAEQDRRRWDRELIDQGVRTFGQACTGTELSAYHVEAAIALCHLTGEPESTDWQRILALYDRLAELRPSPVVRLNRAIALARVHGPRAGIAELSALQGHPRLLGYAMLPAALGALWLEAGDPDRAAAYYRQALELPGSAARQRFLRRKLADCG